MIFLCLCPLFLIAPIISLFVGEEVINTSVVDNAISLLNLLLGYYIFYRLWPTLISPFLLEGGGNYRYPWNRFFVFEEGPYWIGPAIVKTWRWTARRKVAAYTSPPAFLIILFSILCYYATLPLKESYPYAYLIVTFILLLFLLPFLFLVLSLSGWATLILSGKSPMVVELRDIDFEIPEIKRIEELLMSQRMFSNRFPASLSKVVKLVLPHDVVETRGEALKMDVLELGESQSAHDGEYIELWDRTADHNDKLPPNLAVDFQGDILAVFAAKKRSKVYRGFRKLLKRWRTQFPIIGTLH